jgi:formylglycine-generating enzyme required for sulfatase activity
MHFVNVPKGSFWKGGGQGKPGTEQVTIPHDFQIGVYEVTREQWQVVTGRKAGSSSWSGTHLPVETVSWDEIQKEFLPKLNEMDKEDGFLYRLPKENEWEYICRGRASFPGPVDLTKEECSFDFYFAEPTNNLSSAEANFNGTSPAGTGMKGEYRKRPLKVGSFQPNRLGIYDLHGNVWEWCDDLYSTTGSDRVFRGGGWSRNASDCRAAIRRWDSPGYRSGYLGFRVARVPSEAK